LLVKLLSGLLIGWTNKLRRIHTLFKEYIYCL
jgi:hypothetical protein